MQHIKILCEIFMIMRKLIAAGNVRAGARNNASAIHSVTGMMCIVHQ